jgi:hypothetical protein
MRYMFILAIFALISGCVSTPEALIFDNARTYNKPQEEVWQNLMQFFESSSIPVKTQDKEKGTLVAVRKLKRASIYAECGISDVSSVRDGVLTVKISLQSLGGAKTRATVDVTYTAFRIFAGITKNRIECFSNGTLEEEILKNL